MKHYDFSTDQFIEVSPLYKLYWHFCYRKFKLKAWVLHRVILAFGQGVFEEVLTHPHAENTSRYQHYRVHGIAYLWFNGPRGG